jgi:hypothetical protein
MLGLRRAPTPVALLALLVFASTLPLQAGQARAQSTQQGIQLFDLGDQQVTGTSWSFSDDFAITAGAFESLTISNSDFCWVGPVDPRLGSRYGLLFFFQLAGPAGPDNRNGFTYDAYPGNGFFGGGNGDVAGSATISTNRNPSSPATHVEITLSGTGLRAYSDQTLRVCLLGSSYNS